MKKCLFIDKYDKTKKIIEYDKFILVKGGDGTMLRAIDLYSTLKKPFYGLAKGTFNFFMNKKFKINKKTKKIKLKTIKVIIKSIEIELIENEIGSGYKKIKRLKTKVMYAFNEIHIGSFNGFINFNCKDKDKIIGKFKGSGIIVSTAAGSTGINRNNKGIILPLSSKNWSINGVCSDKNINYVLENNKIKIKMKSREEIKIAIDGNRNVINNISEVILEKGKNVKLMFNNINKFKRKRKNA